jgi:hypothetical protein
VGLALLYHAFAELFHRGAREAALSVDGESPTNAPALYRRAGMDVSRSYIIYRRELRPGEEWSDESI